MKIDRSLGKICRYLGKAPPIEVARARMYLGCHRNILEDSMDKGQFENKSDGYKARGTRVQNMEGLGDHRDFRFCS